MTDTTTNRASPRVLWEGEAPPMKVRCRIVEIDDGEGDTYLVSNYLGTDDLDNPTWYRLRGENENAPLIAAVRAMHRELSARKGKP